MPSSSNHLGYLVATLSLSMLAVAGYMWFATTDNNNDNQLSQHTPTQEVQSTVQALKGQFPKTVGRYRYYDIFQKNNTVVYKITALDSDKISYEPGTPNFDDLARQIKQQTRMSACMNSAEMSFFNHGIERVRYDFIRKNGKPFMAVDVLASDCQR